MSLKQATKVETNRVQLEVEVDAATFEQAVAKAYRKNIAKIQVPGFRKGKAPRALVERMYGEGVFYEDAVNDLYPSALEAAIKESGYTYVDDKMDFDVVSVGKEGLVFKATITVKPDITVKNYKGLKAAKKAVSVTAKDVNAELDKIRDRNSRLVTVENRAAENGDTVVIDYVGSVDGVEFEGGKGENHTLVLGSGSFIPGFEEQIVGKNTNDEFDVNVTFPTEYHAKELAGKAAVFKCKLHEIKVKELPELNDDFAKDASDFDTLDAWKADVKATLLKNRQQEADSEFENALSEKLCEEVEGEIPEAMFENRVEESVREFAYRLQSQGLELDMYLKYTGMDMEKFRAGFREQAEKSVKLRLALETIAKLEKVEATDADMEEEYKKLADLYKMDVDKVKTFIPADELAADVRVGKAMDIVKENAVDEKETEKKPAAKKKPAAEKPAAEKKPASKKTATKKTAEKE